MRKRKGRRLAALAGVTVVATAVAAAWAYREEFRVWSILRRDFESLGRNRQGYREYRHLGTGIVFVRLPGGAFDMGSPPREGGILDSEMPRHRVRLSPFLIAKYEVSQSEWAGVMERNPSRFRGDDLPVERVSWNECAEFCRRTGLSLPTEAQWEYACRGGTTSAYAFGDHITTRQVNFRPVALVIAGRALRELHGAEDRPCRRARAQRLRPPPRPRERRGVVSGQLRPGVLREARVDGPRPRVRGVRPASRLPGRLLRLGREELPLGATEVPEARVPRRDRLPPRLQPGGALTG